MKTPRTALLASALVLFCSGLLVTSGWSVFQPATAITGVTRLAGEFLESLEPKQHEQAVLSYDSELRVNWHFIPMETRKGLKLRDMTEPQRDRAYKLLQTCLSEAGYTKARGIMNLEKLLYSLEAVGQRERRDDLKYYFTFFGDPRQEERWGISIEGHHLSLTSCLKGTAWSPARLNSSPRTRRSSKRKIPSVSSRENRFCGTNRNWRFNWSSR